MKTRTICMVNVLALAAAFPQAAAAAVAITASVTAGANLNNYFDPVYGLATGYGNATGTSVQVGNGVEFGINTGATLITADFTTTSLTLKTSGTAGGVASRTFMFVSDTAGFFTNANLASSSYSGATVSVSGNTLTFNTGLYSLRDSHSTVITFGIPAGVPEPATWAMMIGGFGLVGASMRRRRIAVRLERGITYTMG